MKLPEKVRVGETLSARWLNQVVDCLKELAKAANMVGNGTSTSSIEYSGSELRDTKYRGTGGSDLQEFKVFPFQLRLKPKHLCEVDESGNWPKIAQIKAGAIIDYMGKTRPVPENATIYDYTEGWIDIGAFSEKLEKVFCIIKQNYKGEIISADIASEQKDFVPWGKTEENATGEGTLSVFIGSYQLRRINEVNRAISTRHIQVLWICRRYRWKSSSLRSEVPAMALGRRKSITRPRKARSTKASPLHFSAKGMSICSYSKSSFAAKGWSLRTARI